MKKKPLEKIKEQKGSVTLFVLVAMMFFLMIVIFSYSRQAEKINAQKRQITEIQKEYEPENIEEIYYEIEKNEPVKISLYKPNGEIYDVNEWTNQDLTLKIFYPGGIADNYKYYFIDGVQYKYEEGQKITSNCKITVEYGKKNAEVVVNRIDKTAPTVTLSPNGGNYIIPVGATTADITTSLTASDTDNGSGLDVLQYQITTLGTIPEDNDSNWQPFTNGQTITETKTGGTYYLYTKVTDIAGNRATSVKKSNAYNMKYQVTYNANGGTGTPAEQAKIHGTNLTLSSTIPTKQNYRFLGWSTNSTATTAMYQAGGSYSTDVATTLYAVWTPNPQVTITTNPSSITAVSGNPVTFRVAATGNGTLTYQWYYNTSNSTTGGTAISGATGTSYSCTASASRYYYCIVTSNVDGSKASKASATALLTVQAANYSTTRSGTTTYYNTLAQAVSGATSGGGDSGGGTITVLNSLTDTSGVSTNKTITINTNGKTVTRTSAITTTGGTLTTRGTGTMFCNADTPLLYSTGGNISTNGGTLRSRNNVILSSANATSCVINVNGGYIYSDGDLNGSTITGRTNNNTYTWLRKCKY